MTWPVAGPVADLSVPLPGMPPVASPTNIYADAGADVLSPAVRGVPYRIYVPNSGGSTVTVINPASHHGRDVQVMQSVVAQVVAAAEDPLRHLRVLPEPGSDGEHREPRSRAFGLGEQRVSDGYGSLAVEGERHLGPAP